EGAANARAVLDRVKQLGATLVEVETGDLGYLGDDFTVLMYEFKVQIAEYLVGLRHTDVKTLADLIAFNVRHCDDEMRYFGQETFEAAEATSGNLNDPAYQQARQNVFAGSRTNGIDKVMRDQRLDAVIAPGFSSAAFPPAAAGYPSISVPS